MQKKWLITFGVIFLLIVAILLTHRTTSEEAPLYSEGTPPSFNKNDYKQLPPEPLTWPLFDHEKRTTKKHKGTYVTPELSPVNPERFTGFHTGVDFEILPGEENEDVAVYVVCTGKLLEARFGRGYGGMAVQSCELDGKPVTVTYGHIRLTDMSTKVGDILTMGDILTNLGTGFSKETDGERKHLHLGIHKGAEIDTRGYVADKSLLSNWISIEDYLK